MSETLEREEALLTRVSALVSARSGLPSNGPLLGPRLLYLPALDALSDERLIRLGTAVELLRRATLVHRDPKAETTWPDYGRTRFSQTLRGDSLLAESFRLLAADGIPQTVNILSRAMAGVSAGELARREAAEVAIPRMAAYYAGAAEAGARVGGLAAADAEAYTGWGRAVGEAHERALLGISILPENRLRLRAQAPGMDAVRIDALLDRIGAPDA